MDHLQQQLIQHLTDKFGLVFLVPGAASGEVCFANEQGLRPEYRQSFTMTHVMNYIRTTGHENDAELLYPIDVADFWTKAYTNL